MKLSKFLADQYPLLLKVLATFIVATFLCYLGLVGLLVLLILWLLTIWFVFLDPRPGLFIQFYKIQIIVGIILLTAFFFLGFGSANMYNSIF